MKLSISIPTDLVTAVDERRGLATRSAYMAEIVRRWLRVTDPRSEPSAVALPEPSQGAPLPKMGDPLSTEPGGGGKMHSVPRALYDSFDEAGSLPAARSEIFED
jgi:hypothetical protein